MGGLLIDFDSKIEILSNIPEIISVMPQVSGQVMVTSSGFSSGAFVRGVRLVDLKKRSIISENI